MKRTNSGAATSAQARWDPPSSITVPPSYNRTKMREKGTEIKRTFVERQREPRVCDDMGVVVEHRRKITTRNENKISRGGRCLSRASLHAKPRNGPESSLASSDRCKRRLLPSFSSSCPVSFPHSRWRCSRVTMRACALHVRAGEPQRNGPFSAPKTGSVCFRALYRPFSSVYTRLWPGTLSVPERRAIEARGDELAGGRSVVESRGGPEGASLGTV